MSVEFSEEGPQTNYTGSEMKKPSSQEQKDEDPLSPWRAAKPRKPLRDLADAQDSPKGRRQEQENESPPNSSHKESTRLESGHRGVGGLDLSQVVGHCHSFFKHDSLCVIGAWVPGGVSSTVGVY